MKYLKKYDFLSVWWIILVHQNKCSVKKITISYSLKLYIFPQCTDIVYKYIWNMGYGNILREVNVFLFPYIKDHWMVIYQFYADCKPKMAISVEQHRKSFQNQDDWSTVMFFLLFETQDIVNTSLYAIKDISLK